MWSLLGKVLTNVCCRFVVPGLKANTLKTPFRSCQNETWTSCLSHRFFIFWDNILYVLVWLYNVLQLKPKILPHQNLLLLWHHHLQKTNHWRISQKNLHFFIRFHDIYPFRSLRGDISVVKRNTPNTFFVRLRGIGELVHEGDTTLQWNHPFITFSHCLWRRNVTFFRRIDKQKSRSWPIFKKGFLGRRKNTQVSL